MVDTIKFSQMTDGGDLANNEKTPGLQSGANVLFNNPWTFLPPGTTAQRPAPSTAINYRLRFNTDDQLYEYYNAILGVWTQLEEDAVTQGPFVTYTADASLPDAQNLGALADGILRQTITAGVATLDILAIPLMSAYGGTGVDNGLSTITIGGSIEFSGAFTFTGTLTGDTNVTFPTSGTLATTTGASGHVTAGNINELTWYAATGDTVSGLTTANDGVLITSATGVPSISSTLPTVVQGNITQLGAQAQAINMNTHLIQNLVDPVSAQDAATKFYVDTTALNGTSVYAASAATLGTVTQSGAGVGATLTNAGAQATFALDGINPPVGVNVLIKDTAVGMTSANEGIYTVTDAGSGATNWVLTRATSYDTTTEINNTGLIAIQNGSSLAGQAWYNSANIVTVDTTAFNYNRFGTTGTVTSVGSGTGLTGGPITSSGTIAVTGVLADISNNVVGPNKNLVIGGNFDTNPWQRGTSFTNAQAYTADRFTFQNNTLTGAINVTKTADAPTEAQAGIFTTNCYDCAVATADPTVGAGAAYRPVYNMEGYDFAQIAQRPFTISFWVKTAVTGIYSIGMRNNGDDRYYVAEYTVNSANTWEFKSILVPASPSGGTWDYTNAIGLAFYFNIAANASYAGTVGSWQTGSASASANQVNGVATIGNHFKLSLLQMEPGSNATGFEVRTFDEELALCQRYYEKTFNQGTTPVVAASSAGCLSYVAQVGTAVAGGMNWRYKINKRVAPTVTFYGLATTTLWRNQSGSSDSGASSLASQGMTGCIAVNAQVVGDGPGSPMGIHATADADL